MCEQRNANTTSEQNVGRELARKFRWVEFAQIASNVILAVVGIIALCIYSGQLTEMRKSSKAAQDAANAAESAATTAKDTLVDQKNLFQIEQRPYIVVADGSLQFLNPPTASSPIKANITFKNIGKTPAFRMVWNIALLKFTAEPNSGHQKLRNFLTRNYAELADKNTAAIKELSTFSPKLRVELDLAPQATVFSTNQEPPVVLSGDELSVLQKAGGVALFYIGVVNYRDSFGDEYETTFCDLYFGTDPRVWHICDSNNTIK